MNKKITKILSFLLCFLLIFEQSGFAQVAGPGQLDVSLHLSALRQSLTPDKFRPLHLRYLSYDNLNNDFSLLLDKGDFKKTHNAQRTTQDVFIKEETKQLLNYFFIGLSLPNDAFWVNLRPDSPDNIIDDNLAETDVGKILLEADLQLKKDTANFTSPKTLEGKEYWNKLYAKAAELFGSENLTIPTLTRPWIVPGQIIVRETAQNAYIYKATLKVMLEQDYLKDGGSGHLNVRYQFDDPRLKELNEYSSQLIRELIIPKLTKEVNNAKRYAPLRQVYYSLILAQWFKARFRAQSIVHSQQSIVKTNPYLNLIDSKDLTGLTAKEPYRADTYFQAYQKSFKDGEYNIKEPAYSPFGQTMRSYFSGGIIFGAQPGQPGPGPILENMETIAGDAQRDAKQINPKNTISVEFRSVSGTDGEVEIKGLPVTKPAKADEPAAEVTFTTAQPGAQGTEPAPAKKGMRINLNPDRGRGEFIDFGVFAEWLRQIVTRLLRREWTNADWFNVVKIERLPLLTAAEVIQDLKVSSSIPRLIEKKTSAVINIFPFKIVAANGRHTKAEIAWNIFDDGFDPRISEIISKNHELAWKINDILAECFAEASSYRLLSFKKIPAFLIDASNNFAGNGPLLFRMGDGEVKRLVEDMQSGDASRLEKRKLHILGSMLHELIHDARSTGDGPDDGLVSAPTNEIVSQLGQFLVSKGTYSDTQRIIEMLSPLRKGERITDKSFNATYHPDFYVALLLLIDYLRKISPEFSKRIDEDSSPNKESTFINLPVFVHDMPQLKPITGGILNKLINSPGKELVLKAYQIEKEIGIVHPIVGILYEQIIPSPEVPSAAARPSLEDAGKCVTADTLLPVLVHSQQSIVHSKNKNLKPEDYVLKRIVDVKPGDYVLSLNEETQAVEPRRIKGLLDMGVKPVFKLTTASSRSIKTTANHPYLVKIADSVERIAYRKKEDQIGSKWIKVSELKEGMEIAAAAGNLMAPNPNPVRLNNKEAAFKELRVGFFKEFCAAMDDLLLAQAFNINNYYTNGATDVEADNVSEVLVKGKQDSFMLQGVGEDFVIAGPGKASFSGALYLKAAPAQFFHDIGIHAMVGKDSQHRLLLEDDVCGFFAELGSKFNSSEHIFLGNSQVLLRDFVNSISAGEQVENISYRYPRAPDAGFAESHFGINGNSFHNSISHFFSLQKQLYHKLKQASSFIKNAYAQPIPESAVLWDKIVSIEPLPAQRVYDIEVEGTHNFIGNGIFAHNTAIGPQTIPSAAAQPGAQETEPAPERKGMRINLNPDRGRGRFIDFRGLVERWRQIVLSLTAAFMLGKAALTGMAAPAADMAAPEQPGQGGQTEEVVQPARPDSGTPVVRVEIPQAAADKSSVSTTALAPESSEYQAMAAFITEHAPQDLQELLKNAYARVSGGWPKLRSYLDSRYFFSLTGPTDKRIPVVPVRGLSAKTGYQVYRDAQVAGNVLFVDADLLNSDEGKQKVSRIREALTSRITKESIRELIIVSATFIGVTLLAFLGAVVSRKLELGLRLHFLLPPKKKPVIFTAEGKSGSGLSTPVVYGVYESAFGCSIKYMPSGEVQIYDRKGGLSGYSSELWPGLFTALAARRLLSRDKRAIYKKISKQLAREGLEDATLSLILIKLLAEGSRIQSTQDFLLRALWYKNSLNRAMQEKLEQKAVSLSRSSAEIGVWRALVHPLQGYVRDGEMPAISTALLDKIVRLLEDTHPNSVRKFFPILVNYLIGICLENNGPIEQEQAKALLNNIFNGVFYKNELWEFDNQQVRNIWVDKEAEAMMKALVDVILAQPDSAPRALFLAQNILPDYRSLHFLYMDQLARLNSPPITLFRLLQTLHFSSGAAHLFSYLESVMEHWDQADKDRLRNMQVPYLREFIDAAEEWARSRSDSREMLKFLLLAITELYKNNPKMRMVIAGAFSALEGEITFFEGFPAETVAQIIFDGVSDESLHRLELQHVLRTLFRYLETNPPNAALLCSLIREKVKESGKPYLMNRIIGTVLDIEESPVTLENLLLLSNPVLLPRAQEVARLLGIFGISVMPDHKNANATRLFSIIVAGVLNQVIEDSLDAQGKISASGFVSNALPAQGIKGEIDGFLHERAIMLCADFASGGESLEKNQDIVQDFAVIFSKTPQEIIAFVEFLRGHKRVTGQAIKLSRQELPYCLALANSPYVQDILSMLAELRGVEPQSAGGWINQMFNAGVSAIEAAARLYKSEVFKQSLAKGDAVEAKKYWLGRAPGQFSMGLEEAAQRSLDFLNAKYPEGATFPEFPDLGVAMSYALKMKNSLPADTFEACWMSLVEQGVRVVQGHFSGDAANLYFNHGMAAVLAFVHSPEDVVALSNGLIKLMQVCGRRSEEVLKQKLPPFLKLLQERLGPAAQENPALATRLLAAHLNTVNHILETIRIRQPQATDFDVPNEDDKLAITSFVFAHAYDPLKLRAIFDIYFNSEDTATNKQIDSFALKFQKKNPAAFYEAMDDGMKKIHRQQARKLDYNFFIPFMTNLIDEQTTTVRPEAELFFKLFTSKELHRWRSLKAGLRIKADLLDAAASEESKGLFCQALQLLEARWGLEQIPSHQMDEKIGTGGDRQDYRSFVMARELIDLVDIFVDLAAMGANQKADPLAKDFALEWKPRVMRCLAEAVTAPDAEKEKAHARLREAITQFKYFYKSQKLNILYGLFSPHLQESEEQRRANIRDLVRYAARAAVNQEGKTIFDSIVEFMHGNQQHPEVVRVMHRALMSEARGEFKQFRYGSADYRQMFEEWVRQQIAARSEPGKVAGEEEKNQINQRAEELKKQWEANRYYVVKDAEGNTYYLGFTDNFSTLLNLGNPADFGSCQACYKPAYNRGLGGYLANGWNKALVVFDEKGKFISRRLVRLRITDKGELILMREHTYGTYSKDKFMDGLLAKVAADMSLRYQPDNGEQAEEIQFPLWTGNSEWDYSDTYGKQFPEDVGLIRIQGDTVLKGKLLLPLNAPPENPLDASFKPESEYMFKLVADKVQIGETIGVGFDDTSVPRDDFVVVGGKVLFFRGVQVNEASQEELAGLAARPLEDLESEHGRVYLGNNNRLYRLRGEPLNAPGPGMAGMRGAPRAASKQVHGIIHGLFVSRGVGAQKQIFINRDNLAGHLDHFRTLLHPGATIEEAIRFIEGHEAFHALVNHLRDQGNDLSFLDSIEEEKLADTFGRAFALGIGKHDPKLQDELAAIDRLSGFTVRFGQADSLANTLRNNAGKLHERLNAIGVHTEEAQNASPAEMAKLKAELDQAGIEARTNIVAAPRPASVDEIDTAHYQETVAGLARQRAQQQSVNPVRLKAEGPAEAVPALEIAQLGKMPLVTSMFTPLFLQLVAKRLAMEDSVRAAIQSAAAIAINNRDIAGAVQELAKLHAALPAVAEADSYRDKIASQIFHLCGMGIKEIERQGGVEAARQAQVKQAVTFLLRREQVTDPALLSEPAKVLVAAFEKGALPVHMQTAARRLNTLKAIVREQPQLAEAVLAVSEIVMGERLANHIPVEKSRDVAAVALELTARIGFEDEEELKMLFLPDGSAYLYSQDLLGVIAGRTGHLVIGLEHNLVAAALQNPRSLIFQATHSLAGSGYDEERQALQQLMRMENNIPQFLPRGFNTIAIPTKDRPDELRRALSSYLRSLLLYHQGEEAVSMLIFDDSQDAANQAVNQAIVSEEIRKLQQAAPGLRINIKYVGLAEKQAHIEELKRKSEVGNISAPIMSNLLFNRNFITLYLSEPYITVDDDSTAEAYTLTSDRVNAAHLAGLQEAGKGHSIGIPLDELAEIYSSPEAARLNFTSELNNRDTAELSQLTEPSLEQNSLQLVPADVLSAMNNALLAARAQGAEAVVIESAIIGDRDLPVLEVMFDYLQGASPASRTTQSTPGFTTNSLEVATFTTATGLFSPVNMPCPTGDLGLRIDDFFLAYNTMQSADSFRKARSGLALLHKRGPRQSRNLAGYLKSETIGNKIFLKLVIATMMELKKENGGVKGDFNIMLQALIRLRDDLRSGKGAPQELIRSQAGEMITTANQAALWAHKAADDTSDSRRREEMENLEREFIQAFHLVPGQRADGSYLANSDTAKSASDLSGEINSFILAELEAEIAFLTVWGQLVRPQLTPLGPVMPGMASAAVGNFVDGYPEPPGDIQVGNLKNIIDGGEEFTSAEKDELLRYLDDGSQAMRLTADVVPEIRRVVETYFLHKGSRLDELLRKKGIAGACNIEHGERIIILTDGDKFGARHEFLELGYRYRLRTNFSEPDKQAAFINRGAHILAWTRQILEAQDRDMSASKDPAVRFIRNQIERMNLEQLSRFIDEYSSRTAPAAIQQFLRSSFFTPEEIERANAFEKTVHEYARTLKRDREAGRRLYPKMTVEQIKSRIREVEQQMRNQDIYLAAVDDGILKVTNRHRELTVTNILGFYLYRGDRYQGDRLFLAHENSSKGGVREFHQVADYHDAPAREADLPKEVADYFGVPYQGNGQEDANGADQDSSQPRPPYRVMSDDEIDRRIDEIPRGERPGIGFSPDLSRGFVIYYNSWHGEMDERYAVRPHNVVGFMAYGGNVYVGFLYPPDDMVCEFIEVTSRGFNYSDGRRLPRPVLEYFGVRLAAYGDNSAGQAGYSSSSAVPADVRRAFALLGLDPEKAGKSEVNKAFIAQHHRVAPGHEDKNGYTAEESDKIRELIAARDKCLAYLKDKSSGVGFRGIGSRGVAKGLGEEDDFEAEAESLARKFREFESAAAQPGPGMVGMGAAEANEDVFDKHKGKKKVGEIIEEGGRKFEVVEVAEDGTPVVREITTQGTSSSAGLGELSEVLIVTHPDGDWKEGKHGSFHRELLGQFRTKVLLKKGDSPLPVFLPENDFTLAEESTFGHAPAIEGLRDTAVFIGGDPNSCLSASVRTTAIQALRAGFKEFKAYLPAEGIWVAPRGVSRSGPPEETFEDQLRMTAEEGLPDFLKQVFSRVMFGAEDRRLPETASVVIIINEQEIILHQAEREEFRLSIKIIRPAGDEKRDSAAPIARPPTGPAEGAVGAASAQGGATAPGVTPAGVEKEEMFRQTMQETRRSLRGNPEERELCLGIAASLAYRLKQKGVEAKVMVNRDEMWHLEDKPLIHFWVEAEGFILDAFPAGLGVYKRQVTGYLRDESVVIPLRAEDRPAVYQGGQAVSATIWSQAVRHAEVRAQSMQRELIRDQLGRIHTEIPADKVERLITLIIEAREKAAGAGIAEVNAEELAKLEIPGIDARDQGLRRRLAGLGMGGVPMGDEEKSPASAAAQPGSERATPGQAATPDGAGKLKAGEPRNTVSAILGSLAPEKAVFHSLQAYAKAFEKFHYEARRFIAAGADQVVIELEDGRMLKITTHSLYWIGEHRPFDAPVDESGEIMVEVQGSEDVDGFVRYYIQPQAKMDVRVEELQKLRLEIERLGYVFIEPALYNVGRLADGRVALIDPYAAGHAPEGGQTPGPPVATAVPKSDTGKGGIDGSTPLTINSPEGNPGGIDLRALPIVTQPTGALTEIASGRLASLGAPRNDNVARGQSPSGTVPSLEKEWQEIERMIEGGIIPSSQRLKEFVIASCDTEECRKELDKALSCIADILRIEEGNGALTEPALKELLALLESNKKAKELQFALAQVRIEAREPKTIEIE